MVRFSDILTLTVDLESYFRTFYDKIGYDWWSDFDAILHTKVDMFDSDR